MMSPLGLATTLAMLAASPNAASSSLSSGTALQRGDASDPGSSALPTVATAVAAPTAPVLDGKDDDAVWHDAVATSGFRQFQPNEDGDPRFRTEFKAAYDDHNLYIFVRAFDPHPDSIMHALSRRDVRGPSDQLKLIIDAYHDRRSGVELAVNPDGVKRDYAIYDDNNEDDSWNGVWEVATRVDSLGWTAEFRVPFSQLRYASKPSQTFGFGVWRDIERLNERDSWPLYRPSQTGLASQLGELTGIGDIGSSRHLEVTPYALAKNLSRETAGGFERVQEQTVGADLQFSITPNLTLTGTVNPDFGQVEADPAVVNLTAFETFYQERRPFFVEGTGLYRFELNCYIVHDCGNEGLFYSRRIGRSPQLLGLYGDEASATATPIAGAGKLTGRSGNFSFGALDAVTEHVSGSSDRTIEPVTNYAVLRARQDFRDGESSVGLIATAVNRSLDSWSEDYLRREAYVAGARFRHRFADSRYQVSGSFVASRVAGSEAAIAATQRDNVHGFQRPDAPDRYDPTRTSLSGTSAELIFGKYGGGFTRFETALERQSAGFEPNDLGYMQRADQQDWNTWAALVFQKPRSFYRRLQVNGNQWNAWTTDGLPLQRGFNTNAHIWLKNNWWLHSGLTLNNVGGTFCDRCSRGGPALRRSLDLSAWGGINGDSRRTLNPSIWFNYDHADEGRSTYFDVNPYLQIQVSTQLQASVGLDASHNIDDSQWYGNFTDDDGMVHYSFAHLDQRTLGVSTRLSFAATPDLAFDFYAQPFVSSGKYTDIRELSDDPRAPAYANRFQPYVPPADAAAGFDFLQLRSNAVLRWEYRPGSTLYVVWTHARDGYDPTSTTRSWRDEYGDLFALHPANTFLVKLAYWFSN